jgi:WD40 repeat protein
MDMANRFPALCALLFVACSVPAADEKPTTRTDAYSDPLPPGALARLGTARFRHDGLVRTVTFTPDSESIVSTSGDLVGDICVWEAATGRLRRRLAPLRVLEPQTVALAPDGKTVAFFGPEKDVLLPGPDGGGVSIGSPEAIRLVDLATGKELWKAELPEMINSLLSSTIVLAEVTIAFSPKGDLVAVGGHNRQPRLLDARTGKVLRTLSAEPRKEAPMKVMGMAPGGVGRLTFTPDGKRVVGLVSDGTLLVWDVADGMTLFKIDGERHFTISPSGKVLAAVNLDGDLALWNMDNGKRQTRLVGHKGQFWAIRFSPDGKTLASAADDVRLWDVATGKERCQLRGHEGAATVVSFSPDSKFLATACLDDTKVRLWDVATGKELHKLSGHRRNVWTTAFSPDGKTLATGSFDHTIRLWDVATGKEKLRHEGNEAALKGLAFAADGKSLISANDDGTIRLWDPATAKETARLEDLHRSSFIFAAAPDGKTVATAFSQIVLWDVPGRKIRRKINLPVAVGGDPPTPVSARALAFAPDRKMLASGGNYGNVLLWDIAEGEELRPLEGHKKEVTAVVFAPDGRSLISASHDKSIRIWDVPTGKERRSFAGPDPEIRRLVLSPDGHLLASLHHDRLRLWELATGKEVLCFREEEPGPWCLTFAPDGRTLATGTCHGVIELWDMATDKIVHTFRGHQGAVRCLTFAPDGLTLASGGNDTTGLIWDTRDLVFRRQDATKPAARELDAMWADLASADAVKARRAVWALAAAEGAVPLLKERLRPAAFDEKRFARLLEELDGEQFEVRNKATRELEALGELADSGLRRALENRPTFEARRRIEGLLEKQLRDIPASEQLRELRALQVLEQIGSDEARQVLAALAKGTAQARLTQEAQCARATRRRDEKIKPPIYPPSDSFALVTCLLTRSVRIIAFGKSRGEKRTCRTFSPRPASRCSCSSRLAWPGPTRTPSASTRTATPCRPGHWRGWARCASATPNWSATSSSRQRAIRSSRPVPTCASGTRPQDASDSALNSIL